MMAPTSAMTQATPSRVDGKLDERTAWSTPPAGADWIEASYLSQNGSFAFTTCWQRRIGVTGATTDKAGSRRR